MFYCKCLTCNHTGNVNLTTKEHLGDFVCSKCGSKNVISTFQNTGKNVAHCCDISHDNNKYIPKECCDEYYADDLLEEDNDIGYEYKVFEEERLVDSFMMAPTGWEDDEELQDNIGISPGDISDSDDCLYDDALY